MKEVNLKNVNERINRIMESKEIMGRQARLSMNTEFELACLIRLREFMEIQLAELCDGTELVMAYHESP